MAMTHKTPESAFRLHNCLRKQHRVFASAIHTRRQIKIKRTENSVTGVEQYAFFCYSFHSVS